MKPTTYIQVEILGMSVAVILLLCCLHVGEYVGVGWVRLSGAWRDSNSALCKRSLSLCGSSVRGTWKEGFLTGSSESYITNAKEGLGNGAFLSL